LWDENGNAYRGRTLFRGQEQIPMLSERYLRAVLQVYFLRVSATTRAQAMNGGCCNCRACVGERACDGDPVNSQILWQVSQEGRAELADGNVFSRGKLVTNGA